MTRFAEDSQTATISVVCWFLLVSAIIGVLTRLGTKLWIFRKLTKDDTLIIFAIILDIAQTVALTLANKNGYGSHIDTLNEAQINTIMKCQYAQHIIFIGSLACSKISFIMFINSITAATVDHRISSGLLVGMWIWAGVCIITISFQCRPPHVWDYMHGSCFNRVAWENFFNISNIITELVIVGYILFITMRIHTTLRRRMSVACVFGIRTLIVPAIIAQIVLYNLPVHTDVTYTTWGAAIANQITLFVSIITACSAQFKPFLESLQSSGMQLDALSRGHDHKNYHSSSQTGSKILSINMRSLKGLRGIHHQLKNNRSACVEPVMATTEANLPECESTSLASQSRIIGETTTWAATEERDDVLDPGEMA